MIRALPVLAALYLLSAACDEDRPLTATPTAVHTASPTATQTAEIETPTATLPASPTPTASTPTASPTETPTPTQTATSTPPPASEEVPERFVVELARRLGGVTEPIPERLNPPAQHTVGEQNTFFVLDVTGPSIIEVTATLRYASEHYYFYFQDSISTDDGDLEDAGRRLDTEVFPMIVSEFGPDPGAGYDGDPHIAILHADVPGVGGYFTDQDLYPPVISPYSNQREMIVLNASGLDITSDSYAGLVAHETQHLVHHFADDSEDSWINEGLSEVANFGASGSTSFIPLYLQDPDLQLNDWSTIGSSTAHYGQANLFLQYVLRRTGGLENAHLLAEQPGDGFDGLRQYLEAHAPSSTIEELFRDWVVANYLDESGDGPYAYPDYDVDATAQESYSEPGSGSDDVSQFGADYIEYDGDTEGLVLNFSGAETVDVLPTVDTDGGGYWWANRGDSIDTRITREVDLTSVSGATLRYRTWYDIESGWDFGYVVVSADGGQTWEILPASSSTTDNPLRIAYGPGYTGRSGDGGWIDESVDLSAYAGGRILVRFEYVTDEALNQDGWAIDSIEIPEIGFADAGAAGWQIEGFRHVAGPLAQSFDVQVIVQDRDENAVYTLELDAANSGSFAVEGSPDRVVLVVAGTTDGTTARAPYEFAFRRE